MLQLVFMKRAEKHYRRMEKRGKGMDRFWALVGILMTGKQLPESYRDHELRGNYAARRECHTEPDWLLIYRIEERKLIIERTDSHSDLFR